MEHSCGSLIASFFEDYFITKFKSFWVISCSYCTIYDTPFILRHPILPIPLYQLSPVLPFIDHNVPFSPTKLWKPSFNNHQGVVLATWRQYSAAIVPRDWFVHKSLWRLNLLPTAYNNSCANFKDLDGLFIHEMEECCDDELCEFISPNVTVMTALHLMLSTRFSWIKAYRVRGNSQSVLFCWDLTHCGRDKMSAIFQTTFLNGFSWLKIMNFD